MSALRVLLTTLSVRTSAKGSAYLAGWLGKASVVAFPGEADKFGDPTWDLFSASRSPATARQRRAEPRQGAARRPGTTMAPRRRAAALAAPTGRRRALSTMETVMDDKPRNNAPITRGRPFPPGNPGRPKGARHKATQAIQALLDGEGEALTRKAIELALAGDATALRLCMDRILPALRERPVVVELPPLRAPKTPWRQAPHCSPP